ncbi:polyketide cyclase [Persicobacter diffluens]|uniref:Polyketide cyclase n=2 Tax=Persicobacter diffluens TaxID=981 RepID=A0AAN4VZ70_9BACT|nr:polyketide cyclase [Persicobacter diffluens]
MKTFLKILGVIIVLFIAIPLIFALFMEKEYKVSREVLIKKPVEQVFDYVKYLKHQKEYSVWQKMDPDQHHTYNGEDGTVGFVSTWDSQNPDVGRGQQTIVSMVEGQRIDYEIQFFEPFEAKDNAFMETKPVSENQTAVVWGFEGKMPYPMNLLLPLMNMEEMLGEQLQTGLNNLKKVLEARVEKENNEIDTIEKQGLEVE